MFQGIMRRETVLNLATKKQDPPPFQPTPLKVTLNVEHFNPRLKLYMLLKKFMSI